MFTWESAYKIGRDDMDAEHLILFSLLNQLDININADMAADCIDDVLSALAAYMGYHFAHEEALMQEFNYPQLQEHAAKHRELTEHVTHLRHMAKGDDTLRAALKIRSLVLEWLLGHILEVDVQYARFIESKGAV